MGLAPMFFHKPPPDALQRDCDKKIWGRVYNYRKICYICSGNRLDKVGGSRGERENIATLFLKTHIFN